MRKQTVLLAGITLFFISVIAFSFFYGPMRRSFASPPKVVLVDSTAHIAKEWQADAVRGRIAICFTRYLNAVETKESTDLKATEQSMKLGIIRKVFHITPDAAWPEISGALSKRDYLRSTPEGFIGIFDDGRVYIQPLSRFSTIAEKALIIVEPKVWTEEELVHIANKLQSGTISSDLVVIIRGSEKDAELFRRAITQ